ncbi:MAG: ASKHA domain-containing protein [Nitrososphaerales archaeon]
MSSEDKYEVIFLPHGRRDFFPPGTTLMHAAEKLGVDISTVCGGKGTCGKCKVRIDEGYESLGPIKPAETKHLTKDMIDQHYRLACLVKVKDQRIKVYVPEISRVGKQRLQTEGLEVPVAPKPMVRKYFLKLPVPTLHDMRSDEDRILDALADQYGLDKSKLRIDYDVIVKDYLPIKLREANWEVTAVVWNDRVMAIEPGNTTDRCFGFACDIGSTKLAGFLMDLNQGKVVAVGSRMNPQIPMGEDVLSRISYVLFHGEEAQDKLQKAVVGGINEIIDECCEKAGVKHNEIYEMTFVGNVAMQMFFLKFWPKYVAYSPYPPVVKRGIYVPTSKLGLKGHPHSQAYYLPVLGGFVGADQLAVIMATKMLERDEITMDLDIGTNTEIAVGNRELVTCDSCASGPAFEGMEIKFGMRASTGAIEKVTIDPSSLELNYRTIEDAPPVGICGSALIDIPAELLKAGIIDNKGKFVEKMAKQTDRLRKSEEGMWEYVIAWAKESGGGVDITVTQADIRELQKAKAAMHTGAELMLRYRGLTEKDIDKFWLAGAFGNYIDPENARTIGMYPELPTEKYVFVGNAAGTGARMALVSTDMREYAEEISKRVVYYELAVEKDFQSEYARSNYLPHQDLNKYPLTRELLYRLGRIDENNKWIYPE